MAADFTPPLGPLRPLRPFHYWCQKVLPTVYSDSLSYYEDLCKVVELLNDAMQNVDTLGTDVANLNAAYQKLQSYVNDYFTNLDVQEEINEKLDQMVLDGSFTPILNALLKNVIPPKFVSSVSQMSDKSAVYVNTTDGYIYTYNGSAFVNTGLKYGFDEALLSNYLYNISITSTQFRDLYENTLGNFPVQTTIRLNQTSMNNAVDWPFKNINDTFQFFTVGGGAATQFGIGQNTAILVSRMKTSATEWGEWAIQNNPNLDSYLYNISITSTQFRDIYENKLGNFPVQTTIRLNQTAMNSAVDWPFKNINDTFQFFTVGGGAATQFGVGQNTAILVSRMKTSETEWGEWVMNAPRTSKYGVYSTTFDESSFPFVCHRTDDASGMNWSTTGNNDFDHAYPWCDMRECNLENGVPNFNVDRTKDIYVYIPPFYYGSVLSGTQRSLIVSSYASPNLKEFAGGFIGKYFISDAGESMSGYFPKTKFSFNSFSANYQIVDFNTWEALTYLMCVEFNSVNIINTLKKGCFSGLIYGVTSSGFSNYCYAMLSTTGNTIRIPAAASAGKNARTLCPGIYVNISNDKNNTNGRLITNVVHYDEYVDVTFDGEPIAIQAGVTGLNGCPQKTGSTDSIGYHTGWTDRTSDLTDTSTKNYISLYMQNFKYRNIEDLCGNVWTYTKNASISGSKYVIAGDTIEDVTVPTAELTAESGNTILVKCSDSFTHPYYLLPEVIGKNNGGTYLNQYNGELSYDNVNGQCCAMGGGYDHAPQSGIFDFRFTIATANNKLYSSRVFMPKS